MNAVHAISEREGRVLKVIRGELEPQAIPGLTRPIDTCFFDLEGTLYAGKGEDVDPSLPGLYYTVFSIMDATFPDITRHIFTGRPVAYIEAFSHIVHMRRYGPHIFEHGAGICKFGVGRGVPDETEYVLRERPKWIDEVVDTVTKRVKDARIEPGKERTLTFNPPLSMSMDTFLSHIDDDLKRLSNQYGFFYTSSKSGVDIYSNDILVGEGGQKREKADLVAAKRIYDKLGKKDPAVAFFADSFDDLGLLERAQLPATNASAEQDVRAKVATRGGFVSELPHGFGTIEGLYAIIEHNLYCRRHQER